MVIIKTLPKVAGIYRENVLTSKMTWFNVGGVAEVFYKPYDISELSYFIKNINLPINILGVGSNIIIRDVKIPGVLIRLGKGFTNISYCENDNTITVGAATLLTTLSLFAKEHKIAGFEFFIGIPGTVGGALAMNAGAYDGDTASLLKSVKAIDSKGNIHILTKDEMGYFYRGNSLKGQWIFVEATFNALKSDINIIQNRMKYVLDQKQLTQPTRGKTGGSTFKNPPGHKAWKLIYDAGCSDLKVGGAKVSEKHCNFLLNYNNATAYDLEMLGMEICKRVRQKFNINLEWEIKFIG